MEMETAGIFGLARLMGHKAASVNCILANRITGTFSPDPAAAVDHMIQTTLRNLTAKA
jgi:uridine phosphorylase